MANRPWPALNSLRIACEGQTQQGVNWANIFWATVSVGFPVLQTDLTTVAQNAFDAYKNTFLTILANDIKLQRCVVNYYGPQPQQFVGDAIGDENGGATEATLLDSLACVISWTFGQTWRGGKPRTYLPGIPQGALMDSRSLSPDFVADALEQALAFRTAIEGIGFGSIRTPALGVESFFTGGAPRPVGVFFTYTGARVHPRADTMRRRLGREFT